jgi:hypothetical protein
LSLQNIFNSSGNKYNLALPNPMIGENVRFAREKEFPFVVSIKRMNSDNDLSEDGHICTGVLVSNQNVLTIHHCFEYMQNYVTEILIGRSNLMKCHKYFVSWWLSYNDWASSRNIIPQFKTNDITMIRVSCFLNL